MEKKSKSKKARHPFLILLEKHNLEKELEKVNTELQKAHRDSAMEKALERVWPTGGGPKEKPCQGNWPESN